MHIWLSFGTWWVGGDLLMGKHSLLVSFCKADKINTQQRGCNSHHSSKHDYNTTELRHPLSLMHKHYKPCCTVTVHKMFGSVYTIIRVNMACVAQHKDFQSNPVPIEVKTCWHEMNAFHLNKESNMKHDIILNSMISWLELKLIPMWKIPKSNGSQPFWLHAGQCWKADSLSYLKYFKASCLSLQRHQLGCPSTKIPHQEYVYNKGMWQNVK